MSAQAGFTGRCDSLDESSRPSLKEYRSFKGSSEASLVSRETIVVSSKSAQTHIFGIRDSS